jgi:hypothetical protein
MIGGPITLFDHMGETGLGLGTADLRRFEITGVVEAAEGVFPFFPSIKGKGLEWIWEGTGVAGAVRGDGMWRWSDICG